MLNVEGACCCVALVPTEDRACYLGLDCLLADPTPKATEYWRRLGFVHKGGQMWAKHLVETKKCPALGWGKNMSQRKSLPLQCTQGGRPVLWCFGGGSAVIWCAVV